MNTYANNLNAAKKTFRDAEYSCKADWNDADLKTLEFNGKINIFQIINKIMENGYSYSGCSCYK